MNQELMTAATLGTTQRELTGLDTALLDQLDPTDREKNVLVAAALLSMQAQAGWLIPKDQRQLAAPGEKDTGTPLNQRAIRHLLVMLNGHFSKVLPEWLKEVARGDRRVPEEILPMLLDAGRKNAELRDLILPVIGKRGRWLAEQAKDKKWDWFLTGDLEKLWQEGTLETRLEVIKQLRKTDPAQAREMVESVWKTAKAAEREKLLNCFQIGLSMADEPFLEAALDDKAQGVQKTAIAVLHRLSGSRFHQRMQARALPLFSLYKNEIFYELPDALDEAAERDGFPPNKADDMETRRHWIAMMLEVIAPAFWREQWNITSQQLAEAAANSKDAMLYLNAWAYAASYAGDDSMAEFLIPALLAKDPLGTQPGFSTLAERLSPDLLEKLAIQSLQQAASPLNKITEMLLQAYMYPWTAELSRALLDNMRRYLQKGNTRPEPQLRADLLAYALYMPPVMREEIIRTLDVKTSAEKVWGEMIDEMRLLLDFRAEVLAALQIKN